MTEAEFQIALSADPQNSQVRLLLGQLLVGQDRFAEAERLYAEGLELDGSNITLRMNYGEALLDQDLVDDAEEAFRKVLEQEPNHADALASLGGALLRLKEPEEAAEVLERAATLLRGDGIVHELLGEAQSAIGKHQDALNNYQKAAALGRRSPQVVLAIGSLLGELGLFAAADQAFSRGQQLADDADVPWHNWGKALFEMGDVSRAADAFRRSRAQEIDLSLRNLALLIPGDPQASHADVLQTRRDFAQAIALDDDGWSPEPGNSRRLRVGYVSSFFVSANYMKPVYALLAAHNSDRVEVEIFHDGPKPEQVQQQLDDTAVTSLHLVKGMSNLRLADCIRQRNLDVVVDLNAYSAMDRLAIYTVRLARLGVGWFNHYATSAMPALDVIVGDAQTIDAQEEVHYTERVVRLPMSYLTFRVNHATPDVVPPPCLTNGYITFGTLCTQYKITPQLLQAMCEMLRSVPTAHIIIANRTVEAADVAERVWGAFAEQGIDPQRVELRGGADHLQYLANYNDIDIAIDTWPYNGGTTTTEAIWQGVPVLCFRGDRWASRTSASIVADSPFREFLCDSEQSMIDLAEQLGNDKGTPEMLAELRAAARNRLLVSPVCDPNRMAKEMEDLFVRELAAKDQST